MKKQYISPATQSHKLLIESHILDNSRVYPPSTTQIFGHTGFDLESEPTQESLKDVGPDFGPKPIEKATGDNNWESL